MHASGGLWGMRFQSTVFLNKTLSMNSFSMVLLLFCWLHGWPVQHLYPKWPVTFGRTNHGGGCGKSVKPCLYALMAQQIEHVWGDA